MRPATSFTLHAFLAACLAAIAASSAAAGGPAILTLATETTGGAPQAASSDKPRIAVLELQAFEWGNAADTANLGSWAKADGLGVTWDMPGAVVRANKADNLSANEGAAASGLPIGKRQHKPFTLSVPIDKGSVWVRVASPWADCRVGKRFPSLSISDGVKTYRLVGVTVAGCGRSGTGDSRPTEEVAFYYSKISF